MNDYLNSVSTDGDLYRIAFRFIGQLEDTSDRSAIASADEREKASRALDLRDKNSKVGSWTRATLKMVAENPATGSAILANKLGREQAELKRDMRKLKSLGLTISLEAGYRLSAKGQSVVDQKI
jgi:biotin operon repressor